MENNKQPMAYDLHYDEIRQVLVKHLNEYPNQLVGELAELMRTKNDQALEGMVLMKTTEFDEVAKKIEKEAHQAGIDEAVDENTSDGYHTFKELYEFRLLYNAHLFNEWAKQGMYDVHKSKKHSDGDDCFGGGWFVVVATLPSGDISNHYELKDWDLFQCNERETAKEWDGHTSEDVLIRLNSL